MVKGKQAGRGIVNDQVIAHLGVELGAPVGLPRIVNIPDELVSIEPQLADVAPGLSHGTLAIPDCTDRSWVSFCEEGDNRKRFARLAVLYGWCHSGDHQVIFANQQPRLVYSVDHGHFFPGGPEWRIETLLNAAPPVASAEIVAGCNLPNEDLDEAIAALRRVDDEAICRAIAQPPDEWGININERVALAEYLASRRDRLASK